MTVDKKMDEISAVLQASLMHFYEMSFGRFLQL